ncbi:hypothetical protein [Salinarimonas soli]|uniref:hypothetical protein n=1 Tax=Salinarimonas soli TaxID=1638099 RepID=UPI001AEF14BA|nr:hypothetical protein [Salinarimonas soli]
MKLHYPEAMLAACAALLIQGQYGMYLRSKADPAPAGVRQVERAAAQRRAPATTKIDDKLPSVVIVAADPPAADIEPPPAVAHRMPLDRARRLFVDTASLSGADYARFVPAERSAPETPAREPKPAQDQGRILVAGLWGPTASACSRSEAQRRGMLPMVLDERGARAGNVSCSFVDRTVTGAGSWAIVAQCRSGRERWTSNVRLALSGPRLTWRSERGSQDYVRCDRTMVASR